MKQHGWIAFGLAYLVFGANNTACLDAQAAPEQPMLPRPTSEQLGGTERYLAYVSTDKPIYRTGETVYVRVVVMDSRTHKPYVGDQSTGNAEIRGPKGDTVASGYLSGQGSTLGFSWPVPDGLAGGEYTVRVTSPVMGFPMAERKLDIRVFRAPRLKSQIVFARDGYGPGDRVSGTVHTERAEGGIPAGAKVIVTARVDDAEVYRGEIRVDNHGNATAGFELPEQITRGEGTLAFAIEDGGVVETATKTIPILLQTIDLTMYPEGGDLVAGLASRVYLEAKTPAQKPADLEAVVVDDTGKEVAAFKTEHEGRGRFALTPKKGHAYTLQIKQPSGIHTTYPLPAIKDEGVVLQADKDVIGRGERARFVVSGSKPQKLTLTLSQKETEVGRAELELTTGWFGGGNGAPKPAKVSIRLADEVDGVLIATLWDEAQKPLAERLVFRPPAHSLKVGIQGDRQSYVPGGTANLTVTTTDENGAPASATVGLTVTDESVLEIIEKRDQAPRLPVMVFLENEVKELEDAHVYLDGSNPLAPLATDLLLGTQGWRRFALVDYAQFLSTYGDRARRVMAVRTPAPQAPQYNRYPGARHARAANAGPGADERPMAFRGEPPPAARAPQAPPAPPPVPMEAMIPQAARAMLAPAPQAPAAAQPMPAPAPQAPAAAQPMPAPAMAMAQARSVAAPRKEEAAAGGGLMMDEKARAREPLLGGGAAGGARAARRAPRQTNFVLVREYGHAVRPERKPSDRVDFADTLYWHAGVTTDAKTGKATVRFGMSDAVTAFRVMADAFDAGGTLGSATKAIKSVEPFYLEPKVPLQVTSGDRIDLPVALVNSTSADLAGISLKVAAASGIVVSGETDQAVVKASSRKRQVVGLETTGFIGMSDLIVAANAGNYADKVTRRLDVRPAGFAVEMAQSGMLEPNSIARLTFAIPTALVPSSMTASANVFATPLGNLTQALTRLMREPSGCFEQTSSSNYPLTMAQQYFTTHQGVDPTLVHKSSEMLAHGYQRLTSYECRDKGYEWFGGASPGHEALTAYGLMEFADMGRARMRIVDDSMVARTRGWLLSRRDGQGGFLRNQRSADSFGRAPPTTTAAYILWALTEAGEKGLDKEIASLLDAAASSKDSYVVALAANVAARAGNDRAAQKLMQQLSDKQDASGAVAGGITTITSSGGQALSIETTALATLAWLKENRFAGQVERAYQYLAAQCQDGRFASTQSTVLALKTIVAYDAARAHPKTGGTLRVTVDGTAVGDETAFTAETQGAIALPSIAERLGPGTHTVTIEMTEGVRMPFSVAAHYNTLEPASSEQTKLSLGTVLGDKKLREGDVTEIRVDVANVTNESVPMPVAIIGVPGGLEVRHDQLKELVKSGKVDAYEVLGREVVLYWRQLAPKKTVSLPISVVAAVPGRYTAPASRVYEYYTDEYKRWVAGVTAEIAPIH